MVTFPGPPLSLWQAHLITAWFAFYYVGSLYISKNARLSFSKSAPVPKLEGLERERAENERWRDDVAVIKARCLAVGVSTAVSCASVCILVWRLSPPDTHWYEVNMSTLDRLGVYPFRANLLSLLVAPALYLGPLYARYLASALPGQRLWSVRADVKPLFTEWISIRNYWVAPLTEEAVFRACVLAVYHLARSEDAPKWPLIFLTPLSFGAAHLHHAWDTYNRLGRTSSALKTSIIQTLFQLAYTSLFGFHCAFIFLRTGSLLPPLVSHVWCNVFGLPEIVWELKNFPTHRRRILLAYALGIAAYIHAMRQWTHTPGSIYWNGEGAATVAACPTCTGERRKGPPSSRDPL